MSCRHGYYLLLLSSLQVEFLKITYIIVDVLCNKSIQYYNKSYFISKYSMFIMIQITIE